MTKKIAFPDAQNVTRFSGADSRKFNYFQPQAGRQTLYEDVTVDIQPDPGRWMIQDWLMHFADGTPTHTAQRTRLRSADWHTFRDPNGEWERSLYIRESAIEKHIARTVEAARNVGAFAGFDPAWVKTLETHLSASKHAEYGLAMKVFLMAQRNGPTNMHNNVMAVNATDKLRYAQDLALYMGDIADQLPGFAEDAGKRAWLEHPVWQGVRANVERLATISDWAEQVFSANIVFEPLVGALFRRQFILQFAAHHGDYVTPIIVGTAETDAEQARAYSIAMFRILLDDPEHAAYNRGVIDEWLSTYVPLSVKAAQLLEPLWQEPSRRIGTFAEAYERQKAAFMGILSACTLSLPGGITL